MVKKDLKRINYPISGRYCASWTVPMALREIIANMLDTESEYRCKYSKGWAEFEDRGPGFEMNCLALGEGDDKDDEQIGQFGEGMKLAMLTCVREGAQATLETTSFSIARVAFEDTGLGCDGLTIYVDESSKRNEGTLVRVKCKKTDFNEAVRMFLDLDTSGEFCRRAYSDSITVPKKAGKGGVYVNGLRTDMSTNWALDYNAEGYRYKTYINRDRTVMSATATNDLVNNLLTSDLMNETLALTFIEETTKRKSCAENRQLSLVYRWDYATEAEVYMWLGALSRYTSKFNPKDYNKIVVSDGNRRAEGYLRDRSYTVIDWSTIKVGPVVRRLFEILLPAATKAFEREEEKAKREIEKHKKDGKQEMYGPYVRVPWKDVPDSLICKLNAAAAAVLLGTPIGATSCEMQGCRYKKTTDLEFFVFSEDLSGVNPTGAWLSSGKVGVQLEKLKSLSMAGLMGVIAHEVAHGVSGADDRTRDFENELTGFLGLVINDSVSPIAYGIDVTRPVRSHKRYPCYAVAADYDTPLAYETIRDTSMAPVDGNKHGKIYPLPEKQDKDLLGTEWFYLGHEYSVEWHSNSTTRLVFVSEPQKSGRVKSLSVFFQRKALSKGIRTDVHLQYGTSKRTVYDYAINSLLHDGHLHTEVPLCDVWPEVLGIAGFSAACKE